MIRLLIVNPTPLTCNLIATALQNEPDMRVMAMAHAAASALEQGKDCEIALVSANLPDGGAFELIAELKKRGCKVVIADLVASQPLIVSYIEAGAAGYVLRDSSADELVSTIRAVDRDEALVSPLVGMALVERMKELVALAQRAQPETPPPSVFHDKLTERETAVLGLLTDGLTNQEIADALIIEVGTVKNHVHRILKKLNVSNRAQAARYYLSVMPPAAPSPYSRLNMD